MSLFEKGRVTHIPTVARHVYDVTGAGDTVIAAFAPCPCIRRNHASGSGNCESCGRHCCGRSRDSSDNTGKDYGINKEFF